jgi:hypothetical protein
MSELADLVTTRLTSQVNAANSAWEKIVSDNNYDLRAWTQDLAKLWMGGLAMAEDVLSFPLRYQQEGRPPWCSLQWNRTTGQPDSAQGEISLPTRLDNPLVPPSATSLERMGPDTDAIQPGDVTVTLDPTGTRLAIAIKNLKERDPDVGTFVGFVTVPNAPQPVAIIFLTITGTAKPKAPAARGQLG